MKKISKPLLLLFSLVMTVSSLYAQKTSDQTSIDLDGVNDFLDLGNDAILAGKTKFTIEFSLHFDNPGGDYTLIGQRTADDNRTFVLQRWSNDFYILFGQKYAKNNFEPCPSELYHFAVVFDGSGANDSDKLKFYINGVMQTLKFISTPMPTITMVTSPPANLVLGCEHNGASQKIQFFNGQFNEFCIWDYPLNASEITNRMKSEVAGNESGLVEYFHFENGIPEGDNTSLTSFKGGKAVSTITPRQMSLNGKGSNFIGRPALFSNLDTSITVVGSVLTSGMSSITTDHQWLDCNNNYAIIPNAVFQSFTPTVKGSYAVKVTQGNCTDTSGCHTINTVGISDMLYTDMVIYPNPMRNELVMKNIGSNKEMNYEISNLVGQILEVGNFNEKVILPTSHLISGLYVIKISTGNASVFYKITKE